MKVRGEDVRKGRDGLSSVRTKQASGGDDVVLGGAFDDAAHTTFETAE